MTHHTNNGGSGVRTRAREVVGDRVVNVCDFCGQPGTADDPVREGRGVNRLGHAHKGCETDFEYAKYEDWRDSQPEPPEGPEPPE